MPGILSDLMFDPREIGGNGGWLGGVLPLPFADRWAPVQGALQADSAPSGGAAFDLQGGTLPAQPIMAPFMVPFSTPFAPFAGGLPPAMPAAPPASEERPLAAPVADSAATPPLGEPTGGSMPSALNSLPIPQLPFKGSSPSIGDRLNAGLMGFANSRAPIPAVANLISGLATGQRSDPAGVARRMQEQAQQASGLPPSIGDRLNAGLMDFANSGAPIPAVANLISGLATGQRSDPIGVAPRTREQARQARYAPVVPAPGPTQPAIGDPNGAIRGVAAITPARVPMTSGSMVDRPGERIGSYGEWQTLPNGDQRILSDVVPDNDWIPGAQYAGDGHHHVPRANYRNLPLPPETRNIFDKATTGQLYLKLDGRGHEYDAFHREYSKATEELLAQFMREHSIKPEAMTPDQARSVLRAVAESEDPRIRYYREFIRRLQMFYRLRSGGRGSE
jgi:hypothetical protein